jgi:hypothetical protein
MSSDRDSRPGSWRAVVEQERQQAREHEASRVALEAAQSVIAASAEPVLGPWPLAALETPRFLWVEPDATRDAKIGPGLYGPPE